MVLVAKLQKQLPDAQVVLFGSHTALHRHLMPDSRPHCQISKV